MQGVSLSNELGKHSSHMILDYSFICGGSLTLTCQNKKYSTWGYSVQEYHVSVHVQHTHIQHGEGKSDKTMEAQN